MDTSYVSVVLRRSTRTLLYIYTVLIIGVCCAIGAVGVVISMISQKSAGDLPIAALILSFSGIVLIVAGLVFRRKWHNAPAEPIHFRDDCSAVVAGLPPIENVESVHWEVQRDSYGFPTFLAYEIKGSNLTCKENMAAYMSPTDMRPSDVKAWCEAHNVTFSEKI